MAAPKRATHTVIKKGLYFEPSKKTGQLEELEVGSQLTLTSKQAEKLEARGMVQNLKDVKTVDVSDATDKALEAAKDDLQKKAEALKAANDRIAELEKAAAKDQG